MSKPHADELASIDPTALAGVTGGAAMDISALLPIMMMKNRRQPAAAAAPAPVAAPRPRQPDVYVNGVKQPPGALTKGTDGTSTIEV